MRVQLSDFDHFMIRLAAQRVAVLLDNDRTARLVSWRGETKRQLHSRYARVEFPSGSRATVPLSRIVAYWDEHGVQVPLPPEGGTT